MVRNFLVLRRSPTVTTLLRRIVTSELTYLGGHVVGQHGLHQRRAHVDPLPVPEPVHVQRRPVEVHERHGGGKVEEARGQYAQARPLVERLARHQPVAVVEVAAAPDHGRPERGQRAHQRRQAQHQHAALNAKRRRE